MRGAQNRLVAPSKLQFTFANLIWVPRSSRLLARAGLLTYSGRCCAAEFNGADDADSLRPLVIRRTSTRRFLARPAALVFCATGLSLPSPIRKILCAGTLYFCATYWMTASARRWLS